MIEVKCMNNLSRQFIEMIKDKQNLDKARWLENYIKHDIKSLGVGIPDIREMMKKFDQATELSKSPVHVQIEFLNDLMKNLFTEPKLAAILYMQLYWDSSYSNEILKLTSFWFDNEWISDWNVCDWLCVRILTPLLNQEPELSIIKFREWNKSKSIWSARASLVPFAQCDYIESHTEVIHQFSVELIKRPERFCKTAVGWVLREYSRSDIHFVMKFLEQYEAWTTKEVIKNATKYIKK